MLNRRSYSFQITTFAKFHHFFSRIVALCQGQRRQLNFGGLGAQWWIEIQKFLSGFFSGACRNLSTDIFSDAALKTFAEISNFSTKDQKKMSQPASNDCPLPPCLPSNYTAAPIRLTDDCSIRKSWGSPLKLQKFQRGLSPPIIYFTDAGAPLLCHPCPFLLASYFSSNLLT